MSVFPGGVAVSRLAVYDWEAADGCRGGTPHLHTASSEGYIVASGHGAVQTLSADGFASHTLQPGDVLWFTPGTVHRLINTEDLELFVVMGNAGLPEAGDAVMTFPLVIINDPEAYAHAAALPTSGDVAASARARRDLALEGFADLRAGGPAALTAFHAAAARLVQPRVDRWRELWATTVAREAELTRERLAQLADADPTLLTKAAVTRVPATPGENAFGMCGRLQTWQWTAS